METEAKKVYVPLAIPDFSGDVLKRPAPLTGDEEAKRLELFNHFTKEDYKIPGITENAELTEAEKFWLVCFKFLYWPCLRLSFCFSSLKNILYIYSDRFVFYDPLDE